MWSVWMRDSAILSYCDFENFSVFSIVRCVYLKKSWILKKQNSNDDCKIFNKQNTKKLRKKNKKERNRVDDNNNTTIMCFTLYPPPPPPIKKASLTRAVSTPQTTVGPGPGLERPHTVCVLVPEAVTTKYIVTSCGNKIKVLRIHHTTSKVVNNHTKRFGKENHV